MKRRMSNAKGEASGLSLFVGRGFEGKRRVRIWSLLLRLTLVFTSPKFDSTKLRFPTNPRLSPPIPRALPGLISLSLASVCVHLPPLLNLPECNLVELMYSRSPISLSSIPFCLSMLFFPDLIFFATRYKYFLCTHEPTFTLLNQFSFN